MRIDKFDKIRKKEKFRSKWDDSDLAEEKRLVEGMERKIMSWKELPDPMKKMIFHHFLKIQENAPPPEGPICHIGLTLAGSHWAIKNSDLNFVEALAATSLAITTYVAVVNASVNVMAVSLVLSALALFNRLLNKGTFIDREKYKILMTLKATGPITLEKLSENLSGMHIFGNEVWTEEKTLKALQDMQSVHLGDGTIQALANQASDGRWAANGI